MKSYKHLRVVLTSVYLIFSIFLISLYGESPVSKIRFSHPSLIKLQSGGYTEIKINVTVPRGNHIYIDHINKKSYSILTEFKISEETGFQIVETKKPAGQKHQEDIILTGSGVFRLTIFDLGGQKSGSRINVPLEITTQMCEFKSGICYPPVSLKKNITIIITGSAEPSIKSGNDPLVQSSGINWITSYDDAIKEAGDQDKNIYAVITAPTWCGACKWMEQQTFTKKEVQDKINNHFVPLRILDTNPDKRKFSFRGYPTSIIMDPDGKILYQKAGGLPPDYLINVLNNYLKSGEKKKEKEEDNIDWADSYETAINRAKSKDKNVYALVTAPSWCKACQWMDQNTFSRKEIQDMLNENFIPLKILDTNVQKHNIKYEYYPTSVIIDSDENIIFSKAGGIGGGELLEILKKYTGSKKKVKPDKPDNPDTNSLFADIKIIPASPANGGENVIGKDFKDQQSNVVLTGLKIRYGAVIDAVTPIYREVKKNGELGREITGKQFGGDGGTEVILKKDGHVIVGLDLYEGKWYGQDVTKQIKVIWQKWDRGASGWDVKSDPYGDGYLSPGGGSNKRIKADKERAAIGIHGRSLKYLNRISLITGKLNINP